ncbi:tyrosine-type recombinase/integrase [Fictibacillus barbaricus]|uniref:Tyrosine-type recombinase/integrase n=1 Tax=Fictibacillus barbaricus TaxID=182136 RepID=A0ABS2ZBH2_9BACL|nr:tyrosine-type recombinase/integrase [Fictibacillus barbaricus]MBN3545265.1 tyrosine-type recombinase/integrase [Fictibacillus barbaricus]GGB60377.1 integrase [Fictibacillus barbaricus]
MEYVEALRDIKQINAIKRYLKKSSERDYVLFVLGINTGLKVSELLSIKVQDLMTEECVIKDFYTLSPSEANKEIFLNETVKKIVSQYIQCANLKRDDYLFMSKKTKLPITRQQAYRVVHQAAEKVGIKGNIGANSMRKTFGYHAYKRGVAISLLQKHFNHSSPSETLKYLGISKDEIIKTQIDVRL